MNKRLITYIVINLVHWLCPTEFRLLLRFSNFDSPICYHHIPTDNVINGDFCLQILDKEMEEERGKWFTQNYSYSWYVIE